MQSPQMSYHVIHTRGFIEGEALELKNRIYELWASQWLQLYQKQGDHHVPKPDDFNRYDIICCLVQDRTVIGMSAHTFVDLHDQPKMNIDFFQTFGGHFRDWHLRANLAQVVTTESLLAHPDHTGKAHGFSVGRLLIRLSNLMLAGTGAQATIAVARVDNGVSAISQEQGFRVVEKDFPCRGFPCDLISLPRGEAKPLTKGDAEFLARTLWRDHSDHTRDWERHDVIPFRRAA